MTAEHMKQILHRRSNGRFRRAPSLEEMGWDVAHGGKECAQCGERWNPLLVSGVCPECGSQEGTMLDDYHRTGR